MTEFLIDCKAETQQEDISDGSSSSNRDHYFHPSSACYRFYERRECNGSIL